MRLYRRLRARLDEDRERGSITAWLATSSIVMIMVVGIAVDLTGQVHAQQHARDVAYQAARAGGQQLQAGQAIRGQAVTTNPHQAAAAANAYLSTAGVSGTVTVTGDTIVVHTSDTYSTRFLSIIGLNTMSVTGEGQARVVRAVGGVEQ